MAPNSSSASFSQTIGRDNATAKPHESEFCPGLTSSVYFETVDSSVPYFVNGCLNAALAVATTFANLVVLLAMRHVSSIRLPSKLLLCSLVLTDLGAGLVVQPQFATLLFIKATHPGLAQCVLYQSVYFTGSFFTTASCASLTAISLDRYAALFFYLKYEQVVTTRRVCVALVFIWSFPLFYATAELWNSTLFMCLTLTITFIILPVISVAYIKIYRRLRSQQVQLHDQGQEQAGNSLNMEMYRRTASAMMWVYVLFLICYVPIFCIDVVGAASSYTTLLWCLWEFACTLVLLNSFLNLLVYCLRLPDVRTEVMKLLRKFCCRSSQQ